MDAIATRAAPVGAGRRVWGRWMLANMVGEVVGFGLAAVLVALAAARVAATSGPPGWAVAVAAVLAVGAVEGTAVGLAQGLVLRGCLPAITWRAWVPATVAGTVLAWGAGMVIGSTVGDAVALPESAAATLLGAAAIGAIAGTLLSAAQTLVLRRAARAAWWWVAAHAGALAAGMFVAFAGMGLIGPATPVPVVAAIGAATGLGIGGLVAALTGLALLRLLRGARAGLSARGRAAGPTPLARPA
ncbi:MAG TPA: hypothetical protein VFL91_31080 [Thermomicrobiales bacterium]|nr:hypothetical protein [Thermomicrobiales bacterium]